MQLLDSKKAAFIQAMVATYGDLDTITRAQIQALVKAGAPDPTWLWRDATHRIGGGVYRIPIELKMKDSRMKNATAAALAPNADAIQNVGTTNIGLDEILLDQNNPAVVPYLDPLYVPFGNYNDVATITESGDFFPYWIYGLSGNGKTLSIEQAHARLKRKLITVPITREADEDSLLGGLRLRDGNTVPFLGPVSIGAMLGCTVLLDETDLGDERMMCLQTALQGRPFLVKRLGRVIVPQPGFNIAATANTKGQGNSNGKFIGTKIMNEAMLDRYITVFEQEYPGRDVEEKILYKLLESYKMQTAKEEQFVTRLLQWAEKVRVTYAQGVITDVITTRRLTHIIRAYKMFGRDRKKAITRTIARFSDESKLSFMQFYSAIDDSITVAEKEEEDRQRKLQKGVDPETGF